MAFRPFHFIASLAAVALLAGCASRTAYQSRETMGSIKDSHANAPAMRVAGPRPVGKSKSTTPALSSASKSGIRAATAAISSDGQLASTLVATKPTDAWSDKSAMPETAKPVTVASAQPTSPDEATPAKAQSAVSAATIIAAKSPDPTAPQSAEARATTDLRRNLGPAPVAIVPPAVKIADPVVAAPPALAPSAVAPTVPLRTAVAAPTANVGTGSLKTLNLAGLWLAQNNMTNARAALADATKDNDPTLLNALAETYDPIALKRYPRLANEADSARAIELYTLAAAKGSLPAKSSLARLQAALAKPQ
jgi:TPR repeat protein